MLEGASGLILTNTKTVSFEFCKGLFSSQEPNQFEKKSPRFIAQFNLMMSLLAKCWEIMASDINCSTVSENRRLVYENRNPVFDKLGFMKPVLS